MPHRTPAASSRAPLPNRRRTRRPGRKATIALLALGVSIAVTGWVQPIPANAATLAAAADSRTSVRPVVALQALAVEQGMLTLRWTETRTPGSDTLDRTVRVESAPATPTGCGSFSVSGAVSLEPGSYEEGTIALGSPPSSGCVRATLALTDSGGETSATTSAAYRIWPKAPAPPPDAEPAAEPWSGKFNLFRKNAFVTQKTFKWCVAASVQMMVNIVRKRGDRSAATQRRMILYAQRWDNGSYGEAGGAEEGGTDVTGWIRALRHFGAGKYRAVGAKTAAGALRVAAAAMRQTGRPAGIMVMEGRHAWVLHGFESRTDPKGDRRASITAVRVSGPLYPKQQANGYDPRPNTRLSVRKLERYFLPTVIGELPGRFVVIVPTH